MAEKARDILEMIWNFPRFFRVFSPAGGIFRNSEPVWCPHSFLCLLFPGKGKRTAFSFCFSKKKTPGKRKKRPGKPFGWFPRTLSIDQSLALDLRRMEVGKSTIEYVGGDEGISPYKHDRKPIGRSRESGGQSRPPLQMLRKTFGKSSAVGINRGEDGQNFHRMTVEGCV